MRQIKFRGLRKDTGKWSYGYLVSVGADTMILPDTEQSYNLLKVQIYFGGNNPIIKQIEVNHEMSRSLES